MYFLYRTLTTIISPLMPFVLARRLARGKEDAHRLGERLGKSSLPRPEGKLIWIHAASVGEANTVLSLIEALLKANPALNIVLTTVTVTSAALMATRLPARALHQFAPVDMLPAVQGFITHWHPDVALFVDSELWPNLIVEAHKQGAVLGLLNARMSERSFKRWKLARPFIAKLLCCFTLCFAQSEMDAKRLTALGLPKVNGISNLKYDAAALPCDAGEWARLKSQIGDRPVWVAASTHPGEEEILAQVHHSLVAQGIHPLTIIIPRHAVRSDEVAKVLEPLHVARRSNSEPIAPDTDVYLADTMGELGLFYRLAPVVFIGGTLVAHGGQNPLEAARLGCAIIAGPHMENFAAIASGMECEQALMRVKDAQGLTDILAKLFTHPATRSELAQNAERHMRTHEGALASITQELQRYLG